MKSNIVDYICEPNNYKIRIIDSTYGVITVALLVGEKLALYHKYKYIYEELNYKVGNQVVKKFCDHLEEGQVKPFEKNTMYKEAAKNSLKKVYNRLGLLVWERK